MKPTEPGDMNEDVIQLADDIASLSAHIAAATQRLLDMIRRFDDARGWERDGRTSCADWLNWKTGLAMSTAYEHVRVAHRLAELPALDEAFGRGVLSYTKVRAIARVANEEDEAAWVEEALTHTGEELEQACRDQYDGEVLRGRRQPERWLRRKSLVDGTVEIRIKVRAEEAELFMKAIEQARRELSSAEEPGDLDDAATAQDLLDTEHRRLEEQRADAVMHIVTSWAEGGAPHEDPRPSRRSARTQILVRLDVDAKGDRARLYDSQRWLSEDALERLSCDSAVAVTSVRGDDVLNIGRSRRTVSSPLARALLLRDDGCVFPGCHNRLWLDAHHIRHWSQGGETSLNNLCTLCPRHHVLVHEGGFTVERTPEGVIFHSPDGSVVPATPEPMEATHDPVTLLEMLNPDVAPPK